MTINIAKTEYLVVNSEDKYEIFIAEDEPIKQVNEFKYIGTTITKNRN